MQNPAHGANSYSASYHQFPPVHNGPVNCLTFARPSVCLSGCDDASVTLYDFHHGKKLQKWTQHQQAITRVSYVPKTQLALSSSRDRTIKLWQEGHPEPKWSVDAHRLPITGLDVDPDNEKLCTGSRDSSMNLWDLTTGQLLRALKISRNLVTHLKYSKSSHSIVQTSEDKEIKQGQVSICTISDDRMHRESYALHYIQMYCDISEDDNYILTCNNGGNGTGCQAMLWDLRTYQLVKEYHGHSQTVMACIFLSPINAASDGDSPQTATISLDRQIRTWNRETAECLSITSVEGSGPLKDLAEFSDASIGVATHERGIQRFLRGRSHTGEWVLRLVSEF